MKIKRRLHGCIQKKNHNEYIKKEKKKDKMNE